MNNHAAAIAIARTATGSLADAIGHLRMGHEIGLTDLSNRVADAEFAVTRLAAALGTPGLSAGLATQIAETKEALRLNLERAYPLL